MKFIKCEKTNISYGMVVSAIRTIFLELLIFCRLISRTFKPVKQHQNMINGGNIGHIVRGKRTITTYRQKLVFQFIIYINDFNQC